MGRSLRVFLCFQLIFIFLLQLSHAGLNESQIEQKLDQVTKSRVIGQNHVMLLNDGEVALQKRIEMIESAQHHIHFTSLTWDDNEVGHLFKKLFIKKAKQGVKIRVILDETVIRGNVFYGSLSKGRLKIVKELRKAGIDVILYNPPGTFSPLWTNTHEKIIIVDGKKAIAGGRNQGTKYFTYTRDSDVYIEGPALHRLQDIFMLKWKINSKYGYRRWLKKVKREVQSLVFHHPVKYRNRTQYHTSFMGIGDLRRILKDEKTLNKELAKVRDDRNRGGLWDLSQFKKKFKKMLKKMKWEKYRQRKRDYTSIPKDRPVTYYRTNLYQNEDTKVRVVHHLPHERGDDYIRNLYLTLIKNANESIVIQNAYFFPKKEILNALVNAGKRGVNVLIMTNSPETTDEGKLKKYMRYPYLKLLELNRRRAGKRVQVYELQNAENGNRRLLHGKTMVVDKKYTLIGSYNLDRKSEDWSSEHATLIYGEQHAEEHLKYYQDAVNADEYKPFTLKKLDIIRGKIVDQMNSESLKDYFIKIFI